MMLTWGVVGDLGMLPDRGGSMEISMSQILAGSREPMVNLGTTVSRAACDMIAEFIKEEARDPKRS